MNTKKPTKRVVRFSEGYRPVKGGTKFISLATPRGLGRAVYFMLFQFQATVKFPPDQSPSLRSPIYRVLYPFRRFLFLSGNLCITIALPSTEIDGQTT